MDQLNKTIESLREFCDTSDAMTKLSEISRRCIYTQNVVDERLDKLQNALPLWEEYESKAGEVRQWLDDVRRRLDDLEGTDNLKAQFDQNEVFSGSTYTQRPCWWCFLFKYPKIN